MGLDVDLKTNIETIASFVALICSLGVLAGRSSNRSKLDEQKASITVIEKELVQIKEKQNTGIRDREEMKIDIRDMREIVSKYLGVKHD